MKNIVFLTGAGISQESGLSTFRDSNGLWNNYKIDEVATSTAYMKDPNKVNDFYNLRRIEVLKHRPNQAHYLIAQLEDKYNVSVVTTNIDNYHELAGSGNVLHLHGEILKARSSNPDLDWMGISHKDEINNPPLYDVGYEGLNEYRDIAQDGWPLRPHVVLFGETVPNINKAIDIVGKADLLIVVGTSLQVQPACTLIWNLNKQTPIVVIDPNCSELVIITNNKLSYINNKAIAGVQYLFDNIEQYLIKYETTNT